ncbi:MAG: class I SAM-dependent methyltransferase [Gammaproteobacteria bacterium]|nr:class I SAM-dependent methyltransferase [Gammaproteobacteria bacterium]
MVAYDPKYPRAHYDRVGIYEWTRLTRSRHGELNFLVHMDVMRRHIKDSMNVLEIGAGAGIYTKELVQMCRRLVVADISKLQLDANQEKMGELGLLNLVAEYRQLDLVDLSPLAAESFDAIVCIGGTLSYLLDKASVGVQQMLRTVKPRGIVILGVMSLINSVVRLMHLVPPTKEIRGLTNTRWLLETGLQDQEHNPETEHYCHMMTSADIDELLDLDVVEIVERRAAGLLGMAGEESLNAVRADTDLWNLIVERELEWSKLPSALDLGDNIVYVVRRR